MRYAYVITEQSLDAAEVEFKTDVQRLKKYIEEILF